MRFTIVMLINSFLFLSCNVLKEEKKHGVSESSDRILSIDELEFKFENEKTEIFEPIMKLGDPDKYFVRRFEEKRCFQDFCSNGDFSVLQKKYSSNPRYTVNTELGLVIDEKRVFFNVRGRVSPVNEKLGSVTLTFKNFNYESQVLHILMSKLGVTSLETQVNENGLRGKGCFKNFYVTDLSFNKKDQTLIVELFNTSKDYYCVKRSRK